MFKLSLRELFLLVALAGVGTAWWMDRARLADSAEANKRLELKNAELERQMETWGVTFVWGDDDKIWLVSLDPDVYPPNGRSNRVP